MSFHLSFTPTQWAIGMLSAFLIGLAKTGVPGTGILSVPLLATLFANQPQSDRLSLGVLLPLLIMGDCFAVSWYRQHTQWNKLRELIASILFGILLGTVLLWILGEDKSHKTRMNVLIGGLVLVMLLVHLARKKWGDKLSLTSKPGMFAVGTTAGFATTVSNAAGPIMTIYMASTNLNKEQFMGTTAWYYLIFNLIKLPIYIFLTINQPDKPIITQTTILFDLAMFPLILVGVYLGKWLLPRIEQQMFDNLMLILAAIAAIKLAFF